MSWLRRLLINKSIPNKGSELRDHHANERTFLAWTRTGIGFAAMALALGRVDVIDRMISSAMGHPKQVQVQLIQRPAKTEQSQLAVVASPAKICLGLSIWSFGYGLFRFVSVKRNLLVGTYVPATMGPVLLTVGSLVVFGALSGHVEGTDSEQEEAENSRKLSQIFSGVSKQ